MQKKNEIFFEKYLYINSLNIMGTFWSILQHLMELWIFTARKSDKTDRRRKYCRIKNNFRSYSPSRSLQKWTM